MLGEREGAKSEVSQSSILLLALVSTVSLGFGRAFVLSKTCVLKWGFLFNKRRGLTTTGHSPSSGGDLSGHSLTGPLSHSHMYTNLA
jgi:hypothetical protein